MRSLRHRERSSHTHHISRKNQILFLVTILLLLFMSLYVVFSQSLTSYFISNFGRYTILTDTVKSDAQLNPSVFSKKGRVFYHNGNNLGMYHGKIYGLAVDTGTTTLVMQIVDLESGKNIGNPIASKNPQIAFGNDIISRIGYTINNKDGLK